DAGDEGQELHRRESRHTVHGEPPGRSIPLVWGGGGSPRDLRSGQGGVRRPAPNTKVSWGASRSTRAWWSFLRLLLGPDREGQRPDGLDIRAVLEGAAGRFQRRWQVGQGPDRAALGVALEVAAVVSPDERGLGRFPGQAAQLARPFGIRRQRL